MDRQVTPLKWVGSPTWDPHLYVNMPFNSLYISKSCVHDMFSEGPLNTNTQIFRALCPGGYSGFQVTGMTKGLLGL